MQHHLLQAPTWLNGGHDRLGMPSRLPAVSMLLGLVLFSATLIVYFKAHTFDFVATDDAYVRQNAPVADGLSGRSLMWAGEFHFGTWTPLSWLSLMLDSSVYGINPRGYHFTSIFLHAVNSVLLFCAIAQATGYRRRSAFIAALFALHPLQVEAVTWISQRTVVLSSFFALVSLNCYVASRRINRPVYRWLALLAFICSVLSRRTLLTLPCIFLLLDYWPLGRFSVAAYGKSRMPSRNPSVWRQVGDKVPYFVASVVIWIIGLIAERRALGLAQSADKSLSLPFINALVLSVTYLGKVFWPSGLTIAYVPQSESPSIVVLIASLILLLAVTHIGLTLRSRVPALIVGWSWYLLAILPMLGLLDGSPKPMADRYMYFPSIGLFLGIGWLVATAASINRLLSVSARTLGIAILLVLSWMSLTQLGYWRNTVTVYQHATECYVGNWPAEEVLGTALATEGQLREGVHHLAAAVRLNPNDTGAHFNLARVFETLGSRQAAIEHYIASSSDPNVEREANSALARLFCEEQDFDRARISLKRLVAWSPNDAEPTLILAGICEQEGKYREAIRYLEDAKRQDPGEARLPLRIAIDLRTAGDLESAIERLRFLGQHGGQWVGTARLELARTLAMRGNRSAAVSMCRELLSDPKTAEAAGLEVSILEAKPSERAFAAWRVTPNLSDRVFIGGVGNVHRSITTASSVAQKYFDQGLAFLYGFSREAALRAFNAALANDPQCAMAYWGVAMASGPNINNISIGPAREKAAYNAATKALRCVVGATSVEKALVLAVAERYSESAAADRASLNKRYADAMRKAYGSFPEDYDVAALTAEALLDLHPWDQWTVDGKAKVDTEEILRLLGVVLLKRPEHLLGLHLYIHALEGSLNPERAKPAADKLRKAAPAIPHLVHMPSHIDVRLGRWQEAVEANERALEAKRRLGSFMSQQESREVVFLHNYHMLAYAAMMEGSSAKAESATQRMISDISGPLMRQSAHDLDPLLALPYEVEIRFGQWEQLLAESAPGPNLPIATALWRYSRGIALAATGHLSEAQHEQQAFLEAKDQMSPRLLMRGNVVVSDLLRIPQLTLSGEILYRQGMFDQAITELRRAAREEDALPYAEPPNWLMPVRHALGAILLDGGKAADAEAVYRDDLTRRPENGWSLFGLARSLRIQGRASEAVIVEQRFTNAWRHADIKLSASCLCIKGKK
jgi:tetratricopeptide (TPR) repeat protein